MKVNDVVKWKIHPEIYGLCEGRVVSSDERTDGKILVRINLREMPEGTKKILYNRLAANPRSRYSTLYYFDEEELEEKERRSDGFKKARRKTAR